VAHWLDKVVALFQADTADLRELARMAGGNPKIFYRGINLEDLDLTGQNIEGMEFSPPVQSKQIPGEQLDLELPSRSEDSLKQRALRIRSAKRQEERVALLLAEFLQDRHRAMQIIESYSFDKARPANAVLNALKKVRHAEVNGKQFSNLQIARKVSGCFAKAEDKRSVVAYFFAKHLRPYPELKEWIRSKSLSKLSKEQRHEFYQFFDDPK
jgi:hypothetical protein